MDLGENVNTPTTRLLTLLNVSALKSRKRTRDEDSPALEKLNKRKTVKLAEDITLDPGPSILSDSTNNGTDDEVVGGNEENDGVDSQGTLSVWFRCEMYSKTLRQISLRHTNNTMDLIQSLYQMHQEVLWIKNAGRHLGRKLANYQLCLVYEMKITSLHRENWPKRQQYVVPCSISHAVEIFMK
jgi:hypothetical protein